MLAISYITAHFLFASAKYLFTQNCKAPSGVEIFDGFSQSELKQDADLARRDLAKDAKIARRRAYAFDSLRLYHCNRNRQISFRNLLANQRFAVEILEFRLSIVVIIVCILKTDTLDMSYYTL